MKKLEIEQYNAFLKDKKDCMLMQVMMTWKIPSIGITTTNTFSVPDKKDDDEEKLLAENKILEENIKELEAELERLKNILEN